MKDQMKAGAALYLTAAAVAIIGEDFGLLLSVRGETPKLVCDRSTEDRLI